MVSLVFYRVFVSTTGLDFFLRPEKLSKRFSFGDGRVRFLLPCEAQTLPQNTPNSDHGLSFPLARGDQLNPNLSANSDLPLPHGLALSETMV